MYLLNAKEDMNQSIRRSYSSVGKYANAQLACLVTALKQDPFKIRIWGCAFKLRYNFCVSFKISNSPFQEGTRYRSGIQATLVQGILL